MSTHKEDTELDTLIDDISNFVSINLHDQRWVKDGIQALINREIVKATTHLKQLLEDVDGFIVEQGNLAAMESNLFPHDNFHTRLVEAIKELEDE